MKNCCRHRSLRFLAVVLVLCQAVSADNIPDSVMNAVWAKCPYPD